MPCAAVTVDHNQEPTSETADGHWAMLVVSAHSLKLEREAGCQWCAPTPSTVSILPLGRGWDLPAGVFADLLAAELLLHELLVQSVVAVHCKKRAG